MNFILKYLFFLLCFQMKTVSVALVLCLNVGVDPPDVVKTTPCARLECWIGKCRSLPYHLSQGPLHGVLGLAGPVLGHCRPVIGFCKPENFISSLSFIAFEVF